MHDIMALMLQHPLKNLELFQFEDSVTALHVLSRFDPDLLITDDRMPKVCGCDIVRQLAERKATFPIIVTSGWSPTNHWFKEFADRGMRISFLSIPYEGKTFYEHLSKLLGPLG
jgi:FixJ family two-component response regulator